MKNKITLIAVFTIIALTLIAGVYAVLHHDTFQPEVLGVADIDLEAAQDDLWNETINKYFNNDGFEGTGQIMTTARGIDITMNFKLTADEQNAEIELFSDRNLAFFKTYEETVYLSDENQTTWYLVNDEFFDANQTFDIENTSNLANLKDTILNNQYEYLESILCGSNICQKYKVQGDNDSEIIVLIDEDAKTIYEVRIERNGNEIRCNIVNSDQEIAEPTNVQIISSEEYSDKIQEIVVPVVTDDLSFLDILGF